MNGNTEKLLTINQLAEATGLPASWWYSRTATGRVPHLKLGRYVRFKLADVQRWLESHRRGGEDGR